ncbi:MAG: transposase [Candidatus Omnitrophica bacterium]|nr:transposase [Candidatus Omnitrophota bacterium]MBU1924088.1 transposase [Candidatus Omnitrophota bacterium]
MRERKRLLIENGCYHIITRGNQKQRVFLEDQDYEAYLKRLRKCKKKFDLLIYGFCLMPNHIHIIGEAKKPVNLIKFMQTLSRSYTEYFNKKYNKVGHLWQNRYISKVIVKDVYMLNCIQYIEFNPLRANLVKSAEEYPWSSFKERVVSLTIKSGILDDLCI